MSDIISFPDLGVAPSMLQCFLWSLLCRAAVQFFIHVVCRVSLSPSGDPPTHSHPPTTSTMTGEQAWAFISIWLRSLRQEIFSTCQRFPTHWFHFLKWSIIFFFFVVVVASLPAATVECDPVIIPQCQLNGVLKKIILKHVPTPQFVCWRSHFFPN